MATAADWMSTASFISMAGLISTMGYAGSVYLMGWTGGFVLLALCLAPYLRKLGHYTVPEFIGSRYESNIARVIAIICAVFISFTYVAGQMRGVRWLFQSLSQCRYFHWGLYRNVYCFHLCNTRRHEGHYLDTGCSILGFNHCIFNLFRLLPLVFNLQDIVPSIGMGATLIQPDVIGQTNFIKCLRWHFDGFFGWHAYTEAFEGK